jgi:hypothetical protein
MGSEGAPLANCKLVQFAAALANLWGASNPQGVGVPKVMVRRVAISPSVGVSVPQVNQLCRSTCDEFIVLLKIDIRR